MTPPRGRPPSSGATICSSSARRPPRPRLRPRHPDDLIGLLQRAAADKLLPTGESGTVRGAGVAPSTTVAPQSWIERGTYLELTANARANELRARRNPDRNRRQRPATYLPRRHPPLPDPAADPTTSGQGIVVTASLDRDEIVRRCGNWDPTLHATNQDESPATPAMTGASDKATASAASPGAKPPPTSASPRRKYLPRRPPSLASHS
ncbi:MAG: hypothetical protein U0841_11785 [Chloroflexia bacterium]